MSLLFISIFGLCLGIAMAAGFFFWKFRKGFRFQARLTVIMLLLTLVPSVPLIVFSSVLMNRSLDVLVAGYLEETLDSSTAAVRELMAQVNSLLLDRLEDGCTVNELLDLADNSGMSYVFRIRNADHSVIDTIFTASPGAAANLYLDDEMIELALEGDPGNIIYLDEHIFESYRLESTGSILVVGTSVDSATVNAVSQIEQASASYGLLRMMRDRMLDRKTIYVLSVFMLALLSFSAIAVASKLSGGIIKPVKALVNGFRSVGEGELDVTVDTKAKDELRYLVDSFNSMVTELKTSQQRLVQSERLAAWRDVARQISHEIKNPLTPIQLSIHRLRNKVSVPLENEKAVEESFETIDEEIESLRRIATEFSEFARMPKPKLEYGGLNEIISGVVSLYVSNEENISIEFDPDESAPKMLIDAEQMRRVFINMIKNSMEAVPAEKGSITISTQYQSGTKESISVMSIAISDNGAGMSEEVLRKLFDPYFTTKKDGTGLGMPIIKRIIEEHNGKIFVQSEEGKGTTIKITLPAG